MFSSGDGLSNPNPTVSSPPCEHNKMSLKKQKKLKKDKRDKKDKKDKKDRKNKKVKVGKEKKILKRRSVSSGEEADKDTVCLYFCLLCLVRPILFYPVLNFTCYLHVCCTYTRIASACTYDVFPAQPLYCVAIDQNAR
jgi:hypothetical protein